MNEEEIDNLLRQFPGIQCQARNLALRVREDTILTVGGRGYYENPMSDLLAFFLDSTPNAAHGLGDLVLSAFLAALEIEDFGTDLAESPIREQVNRIDIVVPGENFVIAIENKIRHGLHNPFAEYRNAIAQRYNTIPEENRICCLLAPLQQDPGIDGWKGVDTRRLISKIWVELGRRQRHLEHTKWVVLLREFLKTVEQELEDRMTEEQIQQIYNIYPQLVEFERLQGAFLNELKQRLRNIAIDIINNVLGDNAGPIVNDRHFWTRGNKWGQNTYALSLPIYRNNRQNVTLLLFSQHDEGAPRYATVLYIANPVNVDQFPRDSEGQEEGLHVYTKKYAHINGAFEAFKEAVRLIVQNQNGGGPGSGNVPYSVETCLTAIA